LEALKADLNTKPEVIEKMNGILELKFAELSKLQHPSTETLH
jgi:hypothetical protein